MTYRTTQRPDSTCRFYGHRLRTLAVLVLVCMPLVGCSSNQKRSENNSWFVRGIENSLFARDVDDFESFIDYSRKLKSDLGYVNSIDLVPGRGDPQDWRDFRDSQTEYRRELYAQHEEYIRTQIETVDNPRGWFSKFYVPLTDNPIPLTRQLAGLAMERYQAIALEQKRQRNRAASSRTVERRPFISIPNPEETAARAALIMGAAKAYDSLTDRPKATNDSASERGSTADAPPKCPTCLLVIVTGKHVECSE